MSDTFWIHQYSMLDNIEEHKPNTAKEVMELLGWNVNDGNRVTWYGSGGDRQLISSLRVAGWKMIWAEASYHYIVRHPDTNEYLEYCEGDVSKLTEEQALSWIQKMG